jgi:hypothetical protein
LEGGPETTKITLGKVLYRAGTELSRMGARFTDRFRPTYALHYAEQSLTMPAEPPPVMRLDTNRNSILSLCRNFIQHKFDILGSGWVNVSPDKSGVSRIQTRHNARESEKIKGLIDTCYRPIDWHTDFKSGYAWDPKSHYTKIRYGRELGVDVKIPWELARMQHLPMLAFAYALSAKNDTKEAESFAAEFRNQILDFMAANPPRFGVNWACAMDVAIRVVNQLVAYHLFHAFGEKFDEPFRALICRSAYEHGLHIINNLEYSPDFRGNHYLADIVGLLFAASYLPRSNETDSWLVFGIRELIAETSSQFLTDGLNFEASICYHGLAAEMVLAGTAVVLGLCGPRKSVQAADNCIPRFPPGQFRGAAPDMFPLNGGAIETPFPPEHFLRLERIAEATSRILDRNFRAPQIGDNDSGRLMKIQPSMRRVPGAWLSDGSPMGLAEVDSSREEDLWIEDNLDFRHLSASFAGLFGGDADREEWKDSLDFNLIRFLANDLIVPIRREHTRKEDFSGNLKLTAFPEFGLYVYKSKNIYFNMRCGSLGQRGRGGHAHNDQLSFELSFRGVPIIVDSGTFCYTCDFDMRNLFRSTAMHNTPVDCGREQNVWRKGLGGLFRMSDRCSAEVDLAENGRFIGRHFGFGYEVVRAARLTDFRAQVYDKFVTNSETSKYIAFHTAPGLEPILTQEGVEIRGAGFRATLRGVGGEWSVEPSVYSPAYGILMRNKLIRLTCADREVRWSIEIEERHSSPR